MIVSMHEMRVNDDASHQGTARVCAMQARYPGIDSGVWMECGIDMQMMLGMQWGTGRGRYLARRPRHNLAALNRARRRRGRDA